MIFAASGYSIGIIGSRFIMLARNSVSYWPRVRNCVTKASLGPRHPRSTRITQQTTPPKGGSLAMMMCVKFVVSCHPAEIRHSNTGHNAAASNPSFRSGEDGTKWPLVRLRFSLRDRVIINVDAHWPSSFRLQLCHSPTVSGPREKVLD